LSSGVARYPTPGCKNIFAFQSTKTAEFEMKNSRKSAEEEEKYNVFFLSINTF